MNFETLIDRFQDVEFLGNLDIETSKVFVDLLIMTVFADGEITEEELEGLSEQWAQLPFAGDEELEDLVGEHGYATRARLEEGADDPEVFRTLLTETAARLEDEETQEAALRMVAIVSLSDGIDADEVQFCYDLGKAFGFDEDRIAAIVDEIYSVEDAD